MTRCVFFGLAYRPPFQARYVDAVAQNLPPDWQALIPVGGDPGGLLLDRIIELITRAERTIFDVSVANANVWVEIGVAISRRTPLRLLTETRPEELPDVLRGARLSVYGGDAGCRASVEAFLAEASPPPTVTVRAAGCDPRHAMVIGPSADVDAIAAGMRSSRYRTSIVAPSAIRDFQDAYDCVADAGAVVLVLPSDGDAWIADEAAGAWVSLGVALGLGRSVAIAAGGGSTVPSDCPALVCRGDGLDDLGARVVSAVSRPPLLAPPPGVGMPALGELQPRPFVPGLVESLLTTAPVAALEAEPGYAKTSSAVLTARESGWPTAWVTISPSPSTADVVESVTSALGEWVPAFGWRALSAARAAEAGLPAVVDADLQGALGRIAQLLAEDAHDAVTAGPVLLVIDNAHLLPDAGAVLGELVRRPPSWLRLLLLAWDIPHLLRQAPGMTTVRADTLAFGAGETASFLRSLLPQLSDAHVRLLHKATRGWPAALAMARAWLVLAPGIELDELRERLSGEHRDVYRLFADAFWERVPEEDRRLLLHAGILPQLGPDEAGEFLGDRLAARDLAERPYFLVEAAPGVFRFHSLFAGFLQRRAVEERGTEVVQRARAAAAHWYADRADTAFALNLAIEAEDWDLAEQVLTPIARALGNMGDARFLMDVLERIPDDVRRRSRPLHETWVRALHAVSDPRALDEARALVAAPGGTTSERAMAELLLIEQRADRGELTDAEVATLADELADSLGGEGLAIVVQARFKSFAARTTRDPNPDHWPAQYEEAMALAEMAEVADVEGVRIEALGHGAAVLDHLVHRATGIAAATLRVRASLGQPVPGVAERVEAARAILAMQAESRALFDRALSVPDDSSSSKIAKAVVRVQRMRTIAYSLAMGVFQNAGAVSDEHRALADAAIRDGMDAIALFDQLGLKRNTIIGITALAEVADAVDDKEQRDRWAAQAAEVAEAGDDSDLARKARRLIGRPTPTDNMRGADRATAEHRERFVAELLLLAGVTTSEEGAVRPVAEREFDDMVALDTLRVETCRHLFVLHPRDTPKLKGLDVALPLTRVTCRLRGCTSRDRSTKSQALLRQFIAAHCAACPLANPLGDEPKELSSDDDEGIYAPLIKHIGLTAEDRSTR
jgi:hypothetical protein